MLPQYRAHSPYSSRSTSLSDPSRPDLFYHLVDPPTPASSSLPAYALSFLSSQPPTPDSGTIIGWLPAEASGDPSQGQEVGLNDFKENRKHLNFLLPCLCLPYLLSFVAKFRSVLHKAIQDGLTEEVDVIHINGALQLQEGWMHIHGNIYIYGSFILLMRLNKIPGTFQL
jgi:hypothetical protein